MEETKPETVREDSIKLAAGEAHSHLFRACAQVQTPVQALDIGQAKIDEKDLEAALLILENRNLCGDILHVKLPGLEFKTGSFMSKLITKLETCSIDSSFFVCPFASTCSFSITLCNIY